MINTLINWIERRGITGISFARSARHASPGTLIFFPYEPGTLNCGITAIVALKRKETSRLPLQDLARALDDVAAYGWEKLTAQGLDPATHYLGGAERLKEMKSLCARLGEQACFYEIYAAPGHQDQISALSRRTADLIDVEDRMRTDRKGRETPHTDSIMAERLTTLQDIRWSLEQEILCNIDQIRRLGQLAGSGDTRSVVGLLTELNLILNNLDRLEVRGRDSAGLSLLFVMQASDYDMWIETLEQKSLLETLQSRQLAAVLGNGSIAVNKEKTGVSLAFTYKVAAEVGSLGDNVTSLRRQIRDDAIFQHLIRMPHIHHTFLAHTRWASVGEISVANCHPMDGDTANTSCLIHVCLNGDIDNYQTLKQSLEQELGRTVPDEITTDTKIIPLQIQRYLNRGEPLDEAFRLAVNDFDGSHAIAMHAGLAPGQLFLAQKGSGQTLFIGLAPDHYVVGSEVYGLVEATSRYVKMDGAKIVPGASGQTQGQIFILQQGSEGELAGMRAMFYDGTPIALSPEDIKETAITSRDIDRQHFPHYFLKEISESPRSVEQTMQGRLAVVERGGQKHPQVLLDETVIPARLEDALKQQKIRHIFFIGQGTAGVAGSVCASLLRTFLSPTAIQVTSCKASEFSGFMLDQQRHDTLVVAITQSGTTTDTNRAIDIARGQQAYTMAIVNRRDSDITFKVDGVLYTSSGRDIEMSVASTKAYYAQIVAGSILGLKLAQLTGARPDTYILAEIEQLWRLPKQMEKVLAGHRDIQVSAQQFAVTKRHWAIVGSGPNKAAADEIRIKLSELCYKTISSDVVEDKKHIDLSAEPLIFVCGSGNREDVLSDIVKDTAIFKAHHATPIVVATEGEHRFDPYADAVIHVPEVSVGLAPIINTLAGHLWGYYAALAISEESRPLFNFRQDIQQHVSDAMEKGLDVYEIVLDELFREKTIKFYQVFKERMKQDRYTSTTDIRTVSDLTLLLKYMAGRLPTADFEFDFGMKGTAPNILATFFDCIGKMIDEMTRPVDAIKHQAKTVTVGTSRLVEQVDGLLFDTLRTHGFDRSHLTTVNVLVLKRLQEVVRQIEGTTLYRISGLNLLGEPVESSTIDVEQKAGSSALLSSRAESDNRLRGTKQIIVKNGNVFIGKGRRDDRSILVIPIMSLGTTIDRLLLLHVDFHPEVDLRQKVEALGGKYQHIRQLVEETRLLWQDGYLNLVQMEDLFGLSAEKISELILAQSLK